jgi:Copper transport outer membrane protein, MctB
VISFRYHLVTIVAVFLALALGVLAGTTVVKQTLVNSLRKGERQAEAQVADQQKQIGALNQFFGQALPWLTSGRLDGREVVVVTHDGSDPAALRGAQQALRSAGAQFVTLTVTSLMDAPTASTRTQLDHILGISEATPRLTVVSAAADALATRLAEGPLGGVAGGATPTPSGSPSATPTAGPSPSPAGPADLLVAMVERGFVRSPDTSDISSVGGPGQLMVVVAGGDRPPAVPIDTFVLPLVDGLAKDGSLVAGVESLATETHPFVPLLRQEPVPVSSDHLVTVDDVDQMAGRVALVLGLSRMVGGRTGGNYGTKPGAESILPAAV